MVQVNLPNEYYLECLLSIRLVAMKEKSSLRRIYIILLLRGCHADRNWDGSPGIYANTGFSITENIS